LDSDRRRTPRSDHEIGTLTADHDAADTNSGVKCQAIILFPEGCRIFYRFCSLYKLDCLLAFPGDPAMDLKTWQVLGSATDTYYDIVRNGSGSSGKASSNNKGGRMTYPTIEENIPFITREQMKKVDQLAMDEYKIDLLQMMENAGRNLANLARQRFLSGDSRGHHVVVLAGTGGNGGGALVCARWLHNYGASVSVYVTKSIRAFSPAAAYQLNILGRMRTPITVAGIALPPADSDLIVDGLIGYNLEGAPQGQAANLISWANGHTTPTLALDMPSGVDATSGIVEQLAIEAAATMTLALPKSGLRARGKDNFVGELYLADIGIPPALYLDPRVNLVVGHIFHESDILQLW
jgi:NAD(P)H-hydrate epimerase